MKMLRIQDEFINPLEVSRITVDRIVGSGNMDMATTIRMRDGSRVQTDFTMAAVAAAIGIAASDDNSEIGYWEIRHMDQKTVWSNTQTE